MRDVVKERPGWGWCVKYFGRCDAAPGVRGERHQCGLLRDHVGDHRCQNCGATSPVLATLPDGIL